MKLRYFFLFLNLLLKLCPGNSSKYEVVIIPLFTDRKNSESYEIDYDRQKWTTKLSDAKNILRAFKSNQSKDRDGDDIGADSWDLLNKIVGGFEVDINLYPYHASYGNNCGAAIIDKNWALTAAHCGKKSYIRVGSKFLHDGKKVMIKEHYIHPSWSTEKKDHPFDYDFQLLELEEPLKFSNNIQPVKIAHSDDMDVGKVLTVTGWGNTRENGPYSDSLRAVRVPIIGKDSCQKVPFPFFRNTLTSRMFCAGYSEGLKDACQGDSGGPAVADGRLYGTVSFGYGCATPGAFGVYSKLAKVRPWLEETTGLLLD